MFANLCTNIFKNSSFLFTFLWRYFDRVQSFLPLCGDEWELVEFYLVKCIKVSGTDLKNANGQKMSLAFNILRVLFHFPFFDL